MQFCFARAYANYLRNPMEHVQRHMSAHCAPSILGLLLPNYLFRRNRAVKNSFVLKLLLSLSLAWGVLTLAPAWAAENPTVRESMKLLKESTEKLGKPTVENGVLYFGSKKINDDFSVVDAVKEKMGGAATLFVKSGSNFIRVSTNVMSQGKRAVGTKLDIYSPAYISIRQGKPFYGVIGILEKYYDTGYEPISDANGKTVGIFFVGFEKGYEAE